MICPKPGISEDFRWTTNSKQLAESRYSQKEFLGILFELAVEDQWFDLQHMIQHDMAKAILADYSFELGEGYLNTDIFFRHWEEVIEVGWSAFCEHTGLPREKVHLKTGTASRLVVAAPSVGQF